MSAMLSKARSPCEDRAGYGGEVTCREEGRLSALLRGAVLPRAAATFALSFAGTKTENSACLRCMSLALHATMGTSKSLPRKDSVGSGE